MSKTVDTLLTCIKSAAEKLVHYLANKALHCKGFIGPNILDDDGMRMRMTMRMMMAENLDDR